MTSASAERIQRQGSAQGGKVRVLLVDESPDDLVDESVLLQRLGCEVFACWSYVDGVQELDKEAWDFVVVGQGSRAFEGRCVLERAVHVDRKLPVLVLAPIHNMPCYLEAMQLGAVDYIEEPVSQREMKRVLETHLPPMVSSRLKQDAIKTSR